MNLRDLFINLSDLFTRHFSTSYYKREYTNQCNGFLQVLNGYLTRMDRTNAAGWENPDQFYAIIQEFLYNKIPSSLLEMKKYCPELAESLEERIETINTRINRELSGNYIIVDKEMLH